MLTAAESQLLQCWCSYVTLDTTEPLTRAMRFQESHGFAPSGRIPDFFGVRLTQIELAYLGGAAMRVGAAETAFGDRSSPFVINLLANWSEVSEDVSNISWVRSLFRSLRPSMTAGVYINFMSGDEDDRFPEAYRDRWARLITVKSHYDPGNFFRLNQNIPPQTSIDPRT